MQFKKSIRLAQLELKHSLLNLLLCWGVVTIFGTMMGYEVGLKYVQGEDGIQYDIVFCLVLGLVPYWFRSKHFQYHKQAGEVWASPSLIMQSMLPIPKKVLFQSRLLIYLVYYLPAAIAILIVTYSISAEIRTLMEPTVYLFFSIIWMTVSLAIGLSLAASDVGDEINVRTMTIAILSIAGSIGALYTVFYIIGDKGILAMMMNVAANHAGVGILICALVLIASFLYWPRYMEKKMRKLDYY